MAAALGVTVVLVVGLALLFPIYRADDLPYVFAIWALSAIAALAGFLLGRSRLVVVVGLLLAVGFFAVFLWDSEEFANDEYGTLYVFAWTIAVSIPFAAWCVAAVAGRLSRRWLNASRGAPTQ